MRQPIESGRATVARANHHVTYPARFQLIAAMNPCRCGHLGDPAFECARAPKCAADYQAKISGPLLDRIDLQVDVPAVPVSALMQDGAAPAESSASVAARVLRAREVQAARYAAFEAENPARLNAHIPPATLEKIIVLQNDARIMLNQAAERLKVSARGYHRLLRTARTIADLDGAPEEIGRAHIAEALSYRRLRLVEN